MKQDVQPRECISNLVEGKFVQLCPQTINIVFVQNKDNYSNKDPFSNCPDRRLVLTKQNGLAIFKNTGKVGLC